MASQRLLKDLLKEKQEPFQLQSYMSERRSQVNHSVTHLQVKKRRPISLNTGLPSRFCRNACFFSLRESPDPKKSPLFQLKSPTRSQNAIFVNIPARTTSILLEAAIRIQKHSSLEGSQTRTRNAFGIFGSVLKKLTQRKKREVSGGKDGGRVSSVKDMLRWESPVVRKIVTRKSERKEREKSSQTQKMTSETQFSRRSSSSGVWSESVTNGERSWDCDFETSFSSSSGSDGLDEFACGLINSPEFSEDKRFCESPFRFVLQTMPSPGGFITPNFSSPAASPTDDCQEMKKESYEIEKLKKLEMEEEEEEEEKERNSPVSVLDPPFEDDDEDIHMDDNNITSSFRSVQKAKHLLLQKLCRFEQLSGLDPMELDKRMSDQETEEERVDEEEMKNLYHWDIITQGVLKTYFEDMTEVPEGREALISDLVAEELQNDSVLQNGQAEVEIAKRVCERLRSWRDVESNTIDMMVERDFRTESSGLWRSKNDVAEAVLDIEYEIFEDLVEELLQNIGGDQ